jgi:hypothetical protein
MSRKSLFVFLAIVGAALGAVTTELGLSLNGVALATGLAGILYYVFKEAKADIAKIGAQSARWTDPKFWLAVISAAITAAGAGELIPPALAESLIAFITLIIGVLFKQDPRLAKT